MKQSTQCVLHTHTHIHKTLASGIKMAIVFLSASQSVTFLVDVCGDCQHTEKHELTRIVWTICVSVSVFLIKKKKEEAKITFFSS